MGMERWTFLRRLLSRFRHVPHHDSEALSTPAPEYQQLWSNRFCVKDFHPKSLPDVNYDEILNGQVEDFSPDCWLDGHIHRFAAAADITVNQNGPFSSHDDVISDTISSGSRSNTSSPRISGSPRNILVDLFLPLYEPHPPPYTDEPPPAPYSEEPPPTYEEAMSSFLDLTPENFPEDDEDADWMWY